MNIGQDKKISAFWNAVIASIILVTTALLLDGNSESGKIVIFEGILFGIKTGNDMLQSYSIQRKNLS